MSTLYISDLKDKHVNSMQVVKRLKMSILYTSC